MKPTITQVSADLRDLRAICILIVSVFAVIALVGCRPSDPVQDVRDQIAAGQHREALEPLRDLIKETPEDMELLFLYGQVLVETGQPGLAEWPLRKAQTDPIWFVRASLLIASVEHTGGNAENAAETYAKVLEAHPDMMNVRIQRANVLARSPRLLHEALAEVDRILEMDPQQLSAYKPRILAYLGLNQPDDAERVLLELGARIEADQSEDDPIQGWHCATMAIFADDKGDEEVARTRWLDCIERYPTHPNVVGRAIGFYRKNLELESALEVARVAFEGDKGQDSGYRLVVSDLLRLLDRHDEAEALLIEGTEEATTQIGRSAALLALAEYYKQIGNLESSADALEKGLAATQKFAGAQPDLLFALADLRIQLGQSDLALELTSRMTVAAHRALVRGAVAHNRKEFAKAIQFYDEATRLWPENAFAPFYGAQAALELGQVDRAFEGFLLSIRIDETATAARMHAARILFAENRHTTAVEMLATTRIPPSVESKLLGLQIHARSMGADAVLKFVNKFS
ncbi:MAG: tetratricopeptide repeat protein, partial [Proteobacteria bacterium]|nr:tetratricopeptide repeat protein [Pseudomonadota bacterium]